jgi:hypothetical protein
MKRPVCDSPVLEALAPDAARARAQAEIAALLG